MTAAHNNMIKKAETLSAFFDLTARDDPPLYEITLWPYRSLSKEGFAATIALVAFAFLIPLLAFLGTFMLWGILPFAILALGGLWVAIQRSYKTAETRETIRLWPDLIAVYRENPLSEDQFWHAHPAFVKLHLHKDHEIEDYLTVTGGHREIELGSFLPPNERRDLRDDLDRALHRANLPQI